MKTAQKLRELYYNLENPAAYGSYTALRRNVSKSVQDVDIKNFLKAQQCYTLHKDRNLKFKRDIVFTTNVDDLWMADLMDMRKLKQWNQGVCYVLLVIDVLSKYVWLKCLKNKSAECVTKAFELVLNSSNRQPVSLQVDKGLEFCNSSLKKLFQARSIKMFSTENNDIKASVAERAIRTIKTKLWRYFTHNNTKMYTNILQELADNYNASYHTTLKCAPQDVTENNVLEIWRRSYSNKISDISVTPKFKCNEHVRISREKEIFKKGFERKWSQEIFIVSRVLSRQPVMYEIKDQLGEQIQGRFYEKELQAVHAPDLYNVEKILRMRTRGNVKEAFVKWEGYSDKFNSWIPARELAKLKKP
jgi:hypothetical protein